MLNYSFTIPPLSAHSQTCFNVQFACGDGRCLNRNNDDNGVCDGRRDCSDGSDESRCGLGKVQYLRVVYKLYGEGAIIVCRGMDNIVREWDWKSNVNLFTPRPGFLMKFINGACAQ